MVLEVPTENPNICPFCKSREVSEFLLDLNDNRTIYRCKKCKMKYKPLIVKGWNKVLRELRDPFDRPKKKIIKDINELFEK